MKNWFAGMLVIMLLAMLAAPAYAMTQEEFAMTCSTKTAEETGIYQAEIPEGKKTVSYSEIGKLPAGAYVRCTGNEDDKEGYVECSIFEVGSLRTVWVKASALVPAWKLVYFQNGGYVKLHDLIVNDQQALNEYCSTYFPGRSYSFNPFEPAFVSDVTISEAWAKQQFGEDSVAMPAHLVSVGLSTSVVVTTNGEMVVPTEHLDFGGDVDAKHRVGTVLAPRTGNASLREKAAGNADVIGTCKAGRVVAVLEYGSTYSKIRYEDKEGYIRTDCLEFPENITSPLGTGVIHVKGATDGKTKVAAYCIASSSSVRVNEWITGTNVTVYAKKGSWYTIEKDGWFGYVLQQYLTVEENAAEE